MPLSWQWEEIRGSCVASYHLEFENGWGRNRMVDLVLKNISILQPCKYFKYSITKKELHVKKAIPKKPIAK